MKQNLKFPLVLCLLVFLTGTGFNHAGNILGGPVKEKSLIFIPEVNSISMEGKIFHDGARYKSNDILNIGNYLNLEMEFNFSSLDKQAIISNPGITKFSIFANNSLIGNYYIGSRVVISIPMSRFNYGDNTLKLRCPDGIYYFYIFRKDPKLNYVNGRSLISPKSSSNGSPARPKPGPRVIEMPRRTW